MCVEREAPSRLGSGFCLLRCCGKGSSPLLGSSERQQSRWISVVEVTRSGSPYRFVKLGLFGSIDNVERLCHVFGNDHAWSSNFFVNSHRYRHWCTRHIRHILRSMSKCNKQDLALNALKYHSIDHRCQMLKITRRWKYRRIVRSPRA